jgi:ribosomal protein S19
MCARARAHARTHARTHTTDEIPLVLSRSEHMIKITIAPFWVGKKINVHKRSYLQLRVLPQLV